MTDKFFSAAFGAHFLLFSGGLTEQGFFLSCLVKKSIYHAIRYQLSAQNRLKNDYLVFERMIGSKSVRAGGKLDTQK